MNPTISPDHVCVILCLLNYELTISPDHKWWPCHVSMLIFIGYLCWNNCFPNSVFPNRKTKCHSLFVFCANLFIFSCGYFDFICIAEHQNISFDTSHLSPPPSSSACIIENITHTSKVIWAWIIPPYRHYQAHTFIFEFDIVTSNLCSSKCKYHQM